MMPQAFRRHGLAAIASVGLHGAAAMALLAPWPPRPAQVEPPVVVELVMPAPAPSAEPAAAAQVAETKPAPIRPRAAVQSKPRPKAAPSPAPVQAPTPEPAQDVAASSADASPGDGRDEAMAASAATPGGGSGEAAGRRPSASPPRYTLGAAHTPAPDYPWSARRRGIEGRVVVRLEVDADGRPTAIDLLHSSGDSVLDQAAIATLRHWRLRPATADGVPAAGRIVVPIVFKLT